MKLALRRADRVVFVCKSDQEFGIKKYSLVRPDQSSVVYNGVDVWTYRTSEPSNLRTSGPLFVGTLARNDYAKNLELFDTVASRFNPSEVRFVKLSDPSELPTLDLFLLTSRFEGFPYALLEAALAGIPIIATNVGGVSEFIEHNVTGRLVPSGDADRIEAEIRDLLATPDRNYRLSVTVNRLREAAYQKLVTEFTESSMLEATKRIYEQLLA